MHITAPTVLNVLKYVTKLVTKLICIEDTKVRYFAIIS